MSPQQGNGNKQTPPLSSAKERRKSFQRSRPIEDEIQVEVEIVQNRPTAAVTSDGEDTLNNIRVPSLERDEEARIPNDREEKDEDEEEAERAPLLIQDDSVVIEMAQHDR